MNPLQSEDIHESLLIIERLLETIQENKEDIHLCLRGEITSEYCMAMDQASAFLQALKNQLLNIQSL